MSARVIYFIFLVVFGSATVTRAGESETFPLSSTGKWTGYLEFLAPWRSSPKTQAVATTACVSSKVWRVGKNNGRPFKKLTHIDVSTRIMIVWSRS